MPDTTERVREYLLTNFLFGQADRMPEGEDSLVDSGVVDSTGILELIEFLEETFSIAIADSETVPENLDSIGGIERFVRGKRQAAESIEYP